MDYYAQFAHPYYAIIKKGNTNFVLKIPIVDDRRLEANESFQITVIPPSLPADHHNCTTDLVIVDDDGKLMIYAERHF